MPVPSRHIGRVEPGLLHQSFVIRGSHCVWFMGDAAPLQWKNRTDLPKPDVLIVPYAYCNTPAAWATTQDLGAKAIVLLHMPKPEDDSIGLWQAVRSTVEIDTCSGRLYIPDVNESITIQLARD